MAARAVDFDLNLIRVNAAYRRGLDFSKHGGERPTLPKIAEREKTNLGTFNQQSAF